MFILIVSHHIKLVFVFVVLVVLADGGHVVVVAAAVVLHSRGPYASLDTHNVIY